MIAQILKATPFFDFRIKNVLNTGCLRFAYPLQPTYFLNGQSALVCLIK